MSQQSPAVPLNGAYYGPPVPPYAIPRRRRSCNDGFNNLFCTLVKLIVALVIILGAAALILWLIFRPNELKVYVEDANLSQFNLTGSNTNTVAYNLRVNISVRNPNKKISIYYDDVLALAIYDDSRFGFQALPTFYQGHKNTTMLNPVFTGQGLLLGGSPATFARERLEGFYNFEVKVYTRVRFKAGIFKTRHVKPKFDCYLRLPAPAVDNPKLPAFQRIKCDVDY